MSLKASSLGSMTLVDGGGGEAGSAGDSFGVVAQALTMISQAATIKSLKVTLSSLAQTPPALKPHNATNETFQEGIYNNEYGSISTATRPADGIFIAFRQLAI